MSLLATRFQLSIVADFTNKEDIEKNSPKSIPLASKGGNRYTDIQGVVKS